MINNRNNYIRFKRPFNNAKIMFGSANDEKHPLRKSSLKPPGKGTSSFSTRTVITLSTQFFLPGFTNSKYSSLVSTVYTTSFTNPLREGEGKNPPRSLYQLFSFIETKAFNDSHGSSLGEEASRLSILRKDLLTFDPPELKYEIIVIIQ